jgi:hypothetical protein
LAGCDGTVNEHCRPSAVIDQCPPIGGACFPSPDTSGDNPQHKNLGASKISVPVSPLPATVNLRKEPHRGVRAPFFEAAAKRKHDSRGEPSVRLSALPFPAEYRILARGTSGSSNHHTTFPLRLPQTRNGFDVCTNSNTAWISSCDIDRRLGRKRQWGDSTGTGVSARHSAADGASLSRMPWLL